MYELRCLVLGLSFVPLATSSFRVDLEIVKLSRAFCISTAPVGLYVFVGIFIYLPYRFSLVPPEPYVLYAGRIFLRSLDSRYVWYWK